MRWPGGDTTTGSRLHQPAGQQIAFNFDFVRGGSAVATDQLPVESSLKIVPTKIDPMKQGCGALIDDISEHPLAAGGGPDLPFVGGIYEATDVMQTSFELTTRTSVPAGAVIKLAGVHEHLRVTRDKQNGVYFVPQLDRKQRFTYIWFRDELTKDSGATIELLD